jgi:hypothetical protein
MNYQRRHCWFHRHTPTWRQHADNHVAALSFSLHSLRQSRRRTIALALLPVACCRAAHALSAAGLRPLFTPRPPTKVNAHSRGSFRQHKSEICRGKRRIRGTAQPQLLFRMTSANFSDTDNPRKHQAVANPPTAVWRQDFPCPLLQRKNSAFNIEAYAIQATKPKTITRNLHLSAKPSRGQFAFLDKYTAQKSSN